MTAPRKPIGNTTIQAARTVLKAAHANTLGTIPAPKRKVKYLKTAAGVVVFTGAWFLPRLGFPQTVAYIVAVAGGFMVSEDLVRKLAAFIPEVIGKTVKALKGEG